MIQINRNIRSIKKQNERSLTMSYPTTPPDLPENQTNLSETVHDNSSGESKTNVKKNNNPSRMIVHFCVGLPEYKTENCQIPKLFDLSQQKPSLVP